MELIDISLSLLTLIILEIVLGIDNLVFLSILTEKLPRQKRKKARQWGLSFAWLTRLLLLAFAFYLTKLTRPIVFAFSARDIFLLLGGVFLIWKATEEIHQELAKDPPPASAQEKPRKNFSFQAVVAQVAIMDIIFSLDSVLTAVGLTDRFWIMALAISIAILVMIYASEVVSNFINAYPTLKILALSFLMLVGMVLIADSFSFHIPRGYIYFAMGFSLGVEALNLFKQARKKHQ